MCAHGGCTAVAIEGTSRCEAHTVTYAPKKRYEHHYHQGKHIYSSARWVRLRGDFLRHNPLCAKHQSLGLFIPATIVDHIVEIEDGGEVWDVSNLQGLCDECHKVKTGLEARKRRKKKGNNGFGSLSDY